MKKTILSLFVISILLASVMMVLAAKPIKVDSNGVETGWENSASACAKIQDGTIYYGRVGTPNTEIIPIGYDQWGYNYQAHMFNGGWCDYHPTYRPGGANHQWCLDNMADVELMMKWSDEWLANTDCNLDGKLDRGYSCNPENPTSSGCYGAWLTNHERGSYLGNWDITGDWVLEFDYHDSLYIHDMKVIDNTFVGTGGYPSDSDPYSITWTVAGTIDGDNIEMRIDYDHNSYYVDVVGTIAQDGTMSGTWNNVGQSGTWASSSGVATGETCKYEYFVKIITPADGSYVDSGMWYTDDTMKTEIGPQIWGAYATIQEKTNDPCGELGWEDYKSPSPVGLGFYT